MQTAPESRYRLPAYPESAGPVLRAVPADLQDYLAVAAVRLFLKVTAIAIRLTGIPGSCSGSPGIPGGFPEFRKTRVAQRVEAGPAFFCKGIAAPVQVCHTGIPVI